MCAVYAFAFYACLLCVPYVCASGTNSQVARPWRFGKLQTEPIPRPASDERAAWGRVVGQVEGASQRACVYEREREREREREVGVSVCVGVRGKMGV